MLRQNLPDGLLADVKAYLNITWDDETTDTKISGLVASGMVYLDGKLGRVYLNGKYSDGADYVADGLPRTLLFEYVRYGRDAALDVFENNYTSMILAMQHERMVAAYVGSAESTDA